MTRRPRNSVQDRPARSTLLLRRIRKFLRPIAWASAATVLLLVIAGLLHSAGSDSSAATMGERLGNVAGFAGLRVTHIEVKGRHNTPEPLLRAALGVHIGSPIFGFSLERARKRIEKLSWIDHATVERRLPGTIVVNLQERRPFAIWQHDGKFVLIDRHGQVVTHEDVAQFRQLPLVVGAGAPEATTKLLDALSTLPSIQQRVVAAVRVGGRRWNLVMRSGMTIELPEGHAPAALQRLAQFEHKYQVLERPLSRIDMRLPDRVVFRPQGISDTAANPNAPKKPT